MYNLVKLLTEEPKKLQRLGILFIKLLLTLYITNKFFELNITLSSIIDNPVPKDYSISKLILFLSIAVITWFILWSIMADLILGEFFVWLFSRIGKLTKPRVMEILNMFNVVKKKGTEILPSKHTTIFNEILHLPELEDGEEFNEQRSSIKQYYIITTVTYLILISSNNIELPSWLIWIGALLIVNFFIATVSLGKAYNYLYNHLEDLRNQFSELAYIKVVCDAITSNSFLNEHYQIRTIRKRIELTKKDENSSLPKQLYFFPFCYWNDLLLHEVLDLQLHFFKISLKTFEEHEDTHRVVVSRIKPTKENVNIIRSIPHFSFICCKDEEEVYKHVEVLLFRLTKGQYQLM